MKSLVKARLLVVDDDVGAIHLLSSIVQEFGEVFFATSGDEAIGRVRDVSPDLVLMDAEMPGMNGFAACSALKGDPRFADLPILFVTARSDSEFETRALELGAVDFIAKPPNPAVVKARVRTHLALKQRTDHLRLLASRDGLTGLSNRRSFDEALETEWRRACRSMAPLSLLMVDVDFFKRFNDCYGHQIGDDCLRAVASVLAAAPRRPGETVARYGGEEFAIVLPASDQSVATALAERILSAVADLRIPHRASDVGPEVTISVGVASLHQDGATSVDPCRDTAELLVAAADRALYEAKRAGRNRVVATRLG